MSSQNTHRLQTLNPTIILSPCSNSHGFDERTLILPRSEEHAVKIGRSVVRLQPTSENAIFDCKVLSRNHAILWVDDDGRFLIKDTKSSNGTFVNNERLSNSGEDSEPKELFSGDILQLGVEIVDNAKKVASGCVVSIVRLFDEHGGEHTRSSNDMSGASDAQQMPTFQSALDYHLSSTKFTLVRNDKLFMMSQYVKEAKHRETLLDQKLKQLEEQCYAAQEALATSWQSLINEEQLLSRIEMLGTQLTIFKTKYNNQNGEDKYRKELLMLYEDRANAEANAKDSLRKIEEQLYESQMSLHDAMNRLINQEEDNIFLRQKCQQFEEELEKQHGEYDVIFGQYNKLLIELKEYKKNGTDYLVPNEVEEFKSAAEKNKSNSKIISIKSADAENFTSTFRNDISDANCLNSNHGLPKFGTKLKINFEDAELIVNSLDDDIILQWIHNKAANPGGHQNIIEKIRNAVNTDVKEWNDVPAEPTSGHDSTNASHEKDKLARFDTCYFSTSKSLKQADNIQVCLLTTIPMFLVIYLLILPFQYITLLFRDSLGKKKSTEETSETG